MDVEGEAGREEEGVADGAGSGAEGEEEVEGVGRASVGRTR